VRLGISLNDPFTEVLAAANEGDLHAQNIIGIKYHMGWGTPQNDLEAVKWFRKGAEQGYAASESWLGTMYRNGWGVSKNETQARKLYELAAKQGNISAKSALADPLYNTRR
jgi:TPR repeat protein